MGICGNLMLFFMGCSGGLIRFCGIYGILQIYNIFFSYLYNWDMLGV